MSTFESFFSQSSKLTDLPSFFKLNKNYNIVGQLIEPFCYCNLSNCHNCRGQKMRPPSKNGCNCEPCPKK